MAATGARKSISIYDYPEHLNPFKDDDKRSTGFWTLGRKRTSSITFSGIKELKNSWALKSFMKKGKKKLPAQDTEPKDDGNTSPIIFRRSLQYSSMNIPNSRTTIGSLEKPDACYVYGGSVTPLPRSRFQERLRCTSNYDVHSIGTPRMTRSDITGSRLSVESTNPFDEDPVPPARANRRKKKRAPLPPGVADITVSSANIVSTEDESKLEDQDSMNVPLNIELKILEADEEMQTSPTIKESVTSTKFTTDEIQTSPDVTTCKTSQNKRFEIVEIEDDKRIETAGIENDNNRGIVEEEDDIRKEKIENTLEIVEVDVPVKKSDSEDDILKKVSFPKVDISKYRRNSSVNDEDILLRRRNIEEHVAPNKRSKSLNNDLNTHHVTYDINLNEEKPLNCNKDTNGNEGPQKVVCKLYDEIPRKQSLDNSISSTEREFNEIDKATRELEREISKLNSALIRDDDDIDVGKRLSVSEIKRKFDNNNTNTTNNNTTPNPIPKPRRSNYGSANSPINSGH